MPFLNKFYIEIHRIVSIGPIDGKFNHIQMANSTELGYSSYKRNWLHMW